MTKSEMRKVRKLAREGRPYSGPARCTHTAGVCDRLVCDRVEFTESAKGYRARDRWARRYDALNGAPEGDWDR